MRVLVADDDPGSRIAVRRILEREGYEVLEAADGHEAWRIVSAAEHPRLVILDWMMPGIDGVEICRKLRALEREPYVYTVLLTARSSRDDVLDAFDNGADDYLVKPVDAAELVSRLRAGRRILELQEELLAAREELRFKATHDSLTGVLNHERIVTTLQEELARARRTEAPLSACMVDVDDFKAVNDRLGHLAGDGVLREVARRIGSQLRPYDAIGRYGGEEFLIVLPHVHERSARGVAERLLHAVAGRAIEAEGERLHITVSIGLTTAEPTGGVVARDVIGAADRALYQAKSEGKARYAVQPVLPAAA